jgi:hypothetical protein
MLRLTMIRQVKKKNSFDEIRLEVYYKKKAHQAEIRGK